MKIKVKGEIFEVIREIGSDCYEYKDGMQLKAVLKSSAEVVVDDVGNSIESRFLTVIYAINNEKVFSVELEKIKARFQENIGQPWIVSAISVNDEMKRLELIEEALELRDLDLIEQIICHADLTKISTIADFEL